MDDNTNKTQTGEKKVAYVCEGSCHAEITQEQYDGGLHNCGEKTCTHFGKPFKKLEKSEDEKNQVERVS
jgi:hypothetical protein